MRTSRWKSASSDADFDPYLAGMPAASVRMFRRFIESARACGPVTFELQRTGIVLCGTRRIFASVRPTIDGLTGHINLERRLQDHRVVKTDQLTKRLLFHRYAVGSLSDLDDEFTGWLCEARAIGDGTHLNR